MADLPRHPDADENTGFEPVAASPRWKSVAVAVLIAAVLVTVVVLHLTGVLGAEGHQ